MANHGHIVVFNLDEFRSDAIIVDPEGIRSIRLLSLTYHSVAAHALVLLDTVNAALKDYSHAKTMRSITEWLWEAAVGPILDEIGFIQTPPDDTPWPRVWWVKSRLLNLFPIHAAGYHELSNTPGRTALDRVISSYTPTIKALAYARERDKNRDPILKQNVLVVGMPDTPDYPDLPFAKEEISALLNLLPAEVRTTVVQDPTHDKVLAALSKHQIVHLACHGVSSLDPAESKLLLGDWHTIPLTVLDLVKLNIKSGQLAYLSACHTANTRELRLLDESIDLVSALQLSGYASVLGTLWAVNDEYSVEVAKSTYTIILQGNGSRRIDPSRAATGLHWAVRHLRNRTRNVRGTSLEVPSDPLIWAPYIHLGI
jgi:hypothetical protein